MPFPLLPAAVAGLAALWALTRGPKLSRSTLSPLVFGDSDFVVRNDGVPRLTSAAWSDRIAQQLAARSVMPIAIYQDKNGEHRPAGLVKPGGPNALQWIADEVSKGRAVIVNLKNPEVVESVEARYVPYLANPSTGFGLLASPAEPKL
jgi:hypothetical protein